MAYAKSSAAQLRRNALTIFRAALAAADAGNAVRHYLSVEADWLKAGDVLLPLSSFDRVLLVGAGKAAMEMAGAVEQIVGLRLTGGIVVTKRGHGETGLRSRVFEAGHPIPDDAGLVASSAVQDLVKNLNARDLLIVTISGGASALLPAPVPSLTLEAKQQTTELLLRAGATISQLNAVRKHLSMLKGGRLAALVYPASVVSLLLSDVIGDAPDVIGSGLTAPDPSTFADAKEVLTAFDLLDRVPQAVRNYLEAGLRGEVEETPKPGSPVFENVCNVIVGSNRLALAAAAGQAASLGYQVSMLSSDVQGEAREIGRGHGHMLREAARSGKAVCILSGGETTVTVRGHGLGGRNQEFALAAAVAIEGLENALVLSAGTDGTDGPTDAAGAIAAGDTIERARKLGLDALQYLADNNSYAFFEPLGDLVRTGPTGTNVMDVQVLLAAGS